MSTTTETMERAVIGALMRDATQLADVLSDYPPEMWATPMLERLLLLMVGRHREGLPLSFDALHEALSRYGAARAAGGSPVAWGHELPDVGELLAMETDAIPSAALPQYVADLRDSYAFRRLEALRERMPELMAVQRPLDAVAAITAELEAVASVRQESTRQAVGEIASDVVDEIEAEQSPDHDTRVIPFGIPALDGVLGGGVHPGEVVVIGGRPGDGKTTLARQLCWSATMDGYAVLAMSAEMDRRTWVRLDLARWAGIPCWRLRRGAARLTADEMARLRVAAREMRETLRYDVDDLSGPSLAHVQQAARRVRLERGGLDLLVVDYIQIVGLGAGDGRRLEALNAYVDALRRLAKDMECAVVILSQLSRRAEMSKPSQGLLKEVGGLEDAAHAIVFPWRRESQGEAREQDVHVVKQRHGPRDAVVPVVLDPDPMCFVESEDAFGI